MITENQDEVIRFLGSPAAHGGAAVERIETHASLVFLAGERAWKLKRAVRYDYLDFSTVDRRRAMCEAEFALNRRTAPQLYIGVASVNRGPHGGLAIDGPGEPVEWVLQMRRFDQTALLDTRAASGALSPADMRALGTAVARMHAGADRCTARGGAEAIRWVVDGNVRGFAEETCQTLDRALCARVAQLTGEWVREYEQLLDSRAESGRMRRCHGDLHLGNIVFVDERPTPFDAVEFNEDITCIDVAYDIAFLLMDLLHRGLNGHANLVWNGYLAETHDLSSVGLMPLFLSCRAAVRAKTTATLAAVTPVGSLREGHLANAQSYLSLASALLDRRPACLVAIGGFSGSGKSTVATALAPLVGPPPGAVHVRSDEVRKRLCGVPPSSHLGPEGYTQAMSERVYATTHESAAAIAGGGGAVIADAVYGRESDRHAVERVARDAGVPFVGIWLDAPEPVLVDRVQRRVADVSDADARVVAAQISMTPPNGLWHHLDATQSPADVLREATAVVTNVTSGVPRPRVV